MTITKKHFTIIALLACAVALSTWAFIEHKTKRGVNDQISKELAQRFDETIGVAYPLIESYALALRERADSIEAIAEKAKNEDSANFNGAFGRLWEQHLHTQGCRKVLAVLEEYEYFKISPVVKLLIDSGDNKKKESESIQKLTQAGLMLKEPYLVADYDSLMKVTKEARQLISDCMEVIQPYRSEETNIRAWRELMLGGRYSMKH